jgi:acetoin utilization protein AcuB
MKDQSLLEEIMTREVICLRPDDKLSKALEQFNLHPIHHLLITDGKNGHLLGVLSKSDVLDVFLSGLEKGKPVEIGDLEEIPISEAMTEDPIFLDPSDSIGLAADLILANKFHSLPIVEVEKLTGIVTSHDLLKFAFQKIKPEDLTDSYQE